MSESYIEYMTIRSSLINGIRLVGKTVVVNADEINCLKPARLYGDIMDQLNNKNRDFVNVTFERIDE